MKKRFTEEQIIGFLREAEAGLPIAELCRRHGFSEASYYLWRNKFGGMSVSDAKRLKERKNGNILYHEILSFSDEFDLKSIIYWVFQNIEIGAFLV